MEHKGGICFIKMRIIMSFMSLYNLLKSIFYYIKDFTIRYDELEYIDENKQLIEKLCCSICKLPFQPSSVRLKCGHIFCKEHINDLMNNLNNVVVCAIDNNQTNVDEIKPETIITSTADTLKIKCPYHRQGCTWEGRRSNLLGHWKNNCKYVLYNCSFPHCPYKCVKEKIEEHEKYCQWKPYECFNFNCSFKGILKDKEEHNKVCQWKLVKCPNENCNLEIARCKFMDHKWKCCNQVRDLNFLIEKSNYLHKICSSQYRKLKYLKKRYEMQQKILEKNEELYSIFPIYSLHLATGIPHCINPIEKSHIIKLSEDLLCATHLNPGQEIGSVISNCHIPLNQDIYYYEVKIISEKKGSQEIGIGFCGFLDNTSKTDIMPGWKINSWGYHGDNGNSYNEKGFGTEYGPTYGGGDIIGCGYSAINKSIFFTKNGEFLGYIQGTVWNKHLKLYPMIGMNEGKIKINFGNEKFMYNIEENYSELLKPFNKKKVDENEEQADNIGNDSSEEDAEDNNDNDNDSNDEVNENFENDNDSDEYLYDESSEENSMYDSSISEMSSLVISQ
ncbi:hypothetical protein BCR36DRAFT_413878 [Piromyces finnis]|uniref:B30.2/SPRY domain-containing protein n=1 Tax=Piromyces finnis TaxID=1754191 RepID=A0A1Y1V4H2_9FUNG|nr:hypothetical protein BCR36DRAFT_413878 [Piromyces finnis]|eukprot:ORX46936.1 hypothetical protein BCR36DRAFT_413878 [Piromyces finnis]